MSIEISAYRARVGLFGHYQLRQKGFKPMTSFDLVIWLSILLIRSGDVHKNPGPVTSSSFDSSFGSASSLSSGSLNLSELISSHLSFVHYNVQSLAPKIHQLYADLCSFDVLAFTETWLTNNTSTSDIAFQTIKPNFVKIA